MGILDTKSTFATDYTGITTPRWMQRFVRIVHLSELDVLFAFQSQLFFRRSRIYGCCTDAPWGNYLVFGSELHRQHQQGMVGRLCIEPIGHHCHKPEYIGGTLKGSDHKCQWRKCSNPFMKRPISWKCRLLVKLEYSHLWTVRSEMEPIWYSYDMLLIKSHIHAYPWVNQRGIWNKWMPCVSWIPSLMLGIDTSSLRQIWRLNVSHYFPVCYGHVQLISSRRYSAPQKTKDWYWDFHAGMLFYMRIHHCYIAGEPKEIYFSHQNVSIWGVVYNYINYGFHLRYLLFLFAQPKTTFHVIRQVSCIILNELMTNSH